MIELQSYLSGELRSGSGKKVTLVNPTSGEPVAETGTEGLDLAAALRWARDVGGPTLRAMTFAERGDVLKRMSKALHEVRDELIEVSILNGGTTRSDAKFDIDGATGTLAYYAGLGKQLGDRTFLVEGEGEQLTRSPRFWARHARVPLHGAAVHVNAFNFPAWGLGEKAAVALLAGVPVITKPATSTALLAFKVIERLVSAEVLPRGAVQFVAGSTGDMLEHLGTQDVLAFTGSGSTAAHLRKLESVIGRNVRVNVEADSLNAAVLCEDVEPGDETWQMFIRDTAKEMTQKAGQKCTATRRIFVPPGLIDRVQEALLEELAQVRVGDPGRDDVRMGPLATAQQRADVRAGIERLVKAGAKRLSGEKLDVSHADPEKGFFVMPTLLRIDAPDDVREVHEHEVFGPVATIMPYGSAEEAVSLIARGEGGLVSSVYGNDKKLLHAVVLGIAPHHGRVLIGSKKIADQAIAPGMVLPSCVHGGPGRAGGGEELGGERGLAFYTQRVAIQGDRALLDKLLD